MKIANSYRRIKKYTEANDLLKKKVFPESLSAELHYVYGRIFEENKKYNEALEQYNSALVKDSNHSMTQERMGVVYTSQQNYILARIYLQSAVRLNPTSFEGWYFLGIASKKIGELDQASDCFFTSIKLNKTSPLIPFSSLKKYFT